MINNFYNYVNKEWLEKTEIPDEYSRYGEFDILQQNVFKKFSYFFLSALFVISGTSLSISPANAAPYSSTNLPSLGVPTATSDGFTVGVTNSQSGYTWAVVKSSGGGSATVDNTGNVTVSGLAASSSATVYVTATKNANTFTSNSVTGTSLNAALIPAFPANVTSTSSGFTVQVSNYNASFSWGVTTNSGSATISGTGLITVTGLAPLGTAVITVTTSQTGYVSGKIGRAHV